MQKVQTVSLKFVKDPEFLKEQYESIGLIAKYEGQDLVLYWGKPKRVKPKDMTMRSVLSDGLRPSAG